MKHLFLINPVAGTYDSTCFCSEKIHKVCAELGLNYQIRVSKKCGDLERWARQAAETGEAYRIYACGGDGTLNEVVNGVVGHDNVAITCWPIGSGNDFVRIFSDPARFHDLESLIQGTETRFDLISCADRYAINICSMGLDARIGTQMAAYKALPWVSGTGAYLASTVVNVIRGIHAPYTIRINGETIQGNQTMICICSGRYYGGGFHPVPESEPDDGMLDVLLVSRVSRLQVAKLIGIYKAGRYAELPDLISHYRTREISIHCDTVSVANLDGEALYGTDMTFRVVPQAIRFFYPSGITYHATAV